jgi:ABC-type uncharacterized transport system ATPase subunit
MIVGFLGGFGNGKTYILSQLSGLDIPRGNNYGTEGI